MTGIDGAMSGGSSARASAASARMKRIARSREGGRVPIQRPPKSDPSAKHESAKPPCAREPCSSPKAGIATSTMPKATPIAKVESITVRTAAEPSAPARDFGRAVGSMARTAGVSANQRVPTAVRTAAVTMAADGVATTAMAAASSGPEDEEHLLQPGLERVRGVAQALRPEQTRPDRAHARTERGQRRPGQPGARDQRGDRSALRREQRECRERGRIDDSERHQHAYLPHPVHEPPPERQAARAGQRPHGDDDARDGIRMPLTAQQQHRRERGPSRSGGGRAGQRTRPAPPRARRGRPSTGAGPPTVGSPPRGHARCAQVAHAPRAFSPSEAAPYGRAQRRAPGPRRQNPREFVPSRKAVPLAASGEA